MRTAISLGCLVFLPTIAWAGPPVNLHQQILDSAAQQEKERRARFAAVKTPAELDALQQALRAKFLKLLDGLPESKGPPPAKMVGTIDAEDYVVEKLVLETLPGYYMSALLYKPRKIDGRLPGVISPCGHSPTGKAAASYQTLHINLVKRGHIVLTYDPVGQAERSQFWDADKKKSRFNLVCGEHAVLGNPLYLLGTSLAKYRIWDGMRAIDYLVSLKDVDPERIGCVGNSGGGTLTAYIAALDPRVKAAAICCYITTLPRRMGNRIEADPDSDPEQDIFGFVSEGIDHAGLVALRAPRPTMLGCAQRDFFPIEGARESFAEAQHLFKVAGVPERVQKVEAAEKHGLTLPLRKGVYTFFERWLAGRKVDGEIDEIPVKLRSYTDLLVCKDGQVNVTFRSKHLLTLALEEFDAKVRKTDTLANLLRIDREKPELRIHEMFPGDEANGTLIVCVNGNETRSWQEEKDFLKPLKRQGFAVTVVDPRGVGALRPDLRIKGHEYADPLVGVEENLAYNAFLIGKSLAAMRVADTVAAVNQLASKRKWSRIVLVGRRDSAFVVSLARALEPRVTHAALEEMPLTLRHWFDPIGRPVNAASIVPGMLRDFGDMDDVLRIRAPLFALVAAGAGELRKPVEGVQRIDQRFTTNPEVLLDRLR